MTQTIIVHSFPTIKDSPSEMIVMKLLGSALTAVSVLAGYGVASLSVLGTNATPPTWVITITAVSIMALFFTMRIRSTIRHEANLKEARTYVCETLRHRFPISEKELLRAINGEIVALSNGDNIGVEEQGTRMSLVVLSEDSAS